MALTRRQKQVLDFLVGFINRHGYSPSFEEIGESLDLSSLATVHKHLETLEKKGFIKSRWEQTTQGPPRAYYEATPAGREVVRRYLAEVFVPGSPIAAALGVLMAAGGYPGSYQKGEEVTSSRRHG